MHDVNQAGGKMGVSIEAPDGVTRVVPADRVQEATQAGGKIIPYNLEDQTPKPGFWSAVGDDLSGMAKGLFALPSRDPSQSGGLVHPLTQISKSNQQFQQENAARKAAGYSVPYRAVAPLASQVGMNVPGMEQSAAQGDVAGVLGHAAVPAAMAVTPLVGEGVG